MNNGYYQNNSYQIPQQGLTPNGTKSINPFNQQELISNPEYADNVFYINIGKRVRVFFSYPDSLEWRDRVFEGTIRAAGRDYLILTDQNNRYILLWLIYINYAEFLDTITIPN